MLLALRSRANFVIAHMLSPTLDADFEVGVAMQIRELAWINSALAVETVNILTDATL